MTPSGTPTPPTTATAGTPSATGSAGAASRRGPSAPPGPSTNIPPYAPGRLNFGDCLAPSPGSWRAQAMGARGEIHHVPLSAAEQELLRDALEGGAYRDKALIFSS